MFSRTKLQFSLCHRIPERSFFWKGKQFPVCSRCTGIHLGYFAYPLFLFGVFSFNIWITLLLIIPTYLDGMLQAFCNIDSNNTRRFITGLIAGIGTMSLVSIVGIEIGKIIKPLIIN